VSLPSNAFLTLPVTVHLQLLAEKNPHGVINSVHQQQLSINVLPGFVGDCFVSLHVLPHQLAGNRYQDFLLHDLSKVYHWQ
jgi:hypothetical protein